jgi:hypothetical protein
MCSCTICKDQDKHISTHGINVTEVQIKKELDNFLKFYVRYNYSIKLAKILAIKEIKNGGLLNKRPNTKKIMSFK